MMYMLNVLASIVISKRCKTQGNYRCLFCSETWARLGSALKHQLVHLRRSAVDNIYDFCPFCNQENKWSLLERGSVCELHVKKYYIMIKSMYVYFKTRNTKNTLDMPNYLELLCRRCQVQLVNVPEKNKKATTAPAQADKAQDSCKPEKVSQPKIRTAVK
ncbi:unnamed protein product [Ceutorhynchus assimilis]|uniref:C2H2-type domain-containing protein n=1 Tax=Ceutorhynchus assimilis TaxID=467358 RepID=A0A9N9QS80_9CUCU|nr:unnamed protein product [Ceutorhynchus assimilis]